MSRCGSCRVTCQIKNNVYQWAFSVFAGNEIIYFWTSITIKKSRCKHFLSSRFSTFGVSVGISLNRWYQYRTIENACKGIFYCWKCLEANYFIASKNRKSLSIRNIIFILKDYMTAPTPWHSTYCSPPWCFSPLPTTRSKQKTHHPFLQSDGGLNRI